MSLTGLDSRRVKEEPEFTETTCGFRGANVFAVEEELRVVWQTEEAIKEIHLGVHVRQKISIMRFRADDFVEGKTGVFQVPGVLAVGGGFIGVVGHFADDEVRVEFVASGDGDRAADGGGKPVDFKVDEELGPVATGGEEDGDGVVVGHESSDGVVDGDPGGFAVGIVLGALAQESYERVGVELVDGLYESLTSIDN